MNRWASRSRPCGAEEFEPPSSLVVQSALIFVSPSRVAAAFIGSWRHRAKLSVFSRQFAVKIRQLADFSWFLQTTERTGGDRPNCFTLEIPLCFQSVAGGSGDTRRWRWLPKPPHTRSVPGSAWDRTSWRLCLPAPPSVITLPPAHPGTGVLATRQV